MKWQGSEYLKFNLNYGEIRSSLSCFCCPFQKLQDWKNLYINHPDLFMVAEKWEEMRNQIKRGYYKWRSDKWTLRAIREYVDNNY